jgi:hypothetical protein
LDIVQVNTCSRQIYSNRARAAIYIAKISSTRTRFKDHLPDPIVGVFPPRELLLKEQLDWLGPTDAVVGFHL